MKEAVIISAKIDRIIKRLRKRYKIRRLDNSDPYRVLIRTILSQRTRDENTAEASKLLFSKYKTSKDIANADIEDIQKLIKKAGFFRVKAKRIKEVSRIIQDRCNGIVPDDIKKLLELPGVGRKTANCVLVYGFGREAIPVDVHVNRISNRIGLVNTKSPEETEKELTRISPKKYWLDINELFVRFGQDICRPIGPKCSECPISDLCDFLIKKF